VDALARLRGIGVGLESFLGPVRLRQHGRQLGKGLEILALDGRIDGLFDSFERAESRKGSKNFPGGLVDLQSDFDQLSK